MASWARAEGAPAGVVSLLASVSPPVAREWAIRRGVPDDVVERPSGVQIRRGTYSNTAGMDADLVEAIATVMSQQGQREDERELLEAEITGQMSPPGEGVNDTRMLMFSDGSFGIFKSFVGLDDDTSDSYGHSRPLQPIHEAVAWQLAHKLGPEYAQLVPTTVLRSIDGELGSVSRGVEGEPGAPATVPVEVLERAGFFDALIGQQDRHGNNLLVDDDTLHLIDHGFSFATPGDIMNQSMLHRWRRRNNPSTTPSERSVLARLLESGDLHGMQGVLEVERSAALRARAQFMFDRGLLVEVGDFGSGVGSSG